MILNLERNETTTTTTAKKRGFVTNHKGLQDFEIRSKVAEPQDFLQLVPFAPLT